VQIRSTADGPLVTEFAPYVNYVGSVTVAMGDVTGDGFDDLVTGAAAGNPHVKVYDGMAFATGRFDPAKPDASLVASLFPYAVNDNVGVNVAVGDVEGNGYADIVTGATAGNPHVKIYRGRDIATDNFHPDGGSLLASFFPYALDFNLGVNVAVGDVNGDRFADIITGTMAGNPHVKAFSGHDIAAHKFNPGGDSLLASFFPYGLGFNLGVHVAAGDITGDGLADIITGASLGNPEVKVYDGRAIKEGQLTDRMAEAAVVDRFFAFGLSQNIGVTVGASDFEGTGRWDIITGATTGPASFRVLRGTASGVHPPAVFEDTLNGVPAGLTVGA
jgi:hypothetical protein